MHPDERRFHGVEHSHVDGRDENDIARSVHRGIERPSRTAAVPAMQALGCLANPDRPTFAIGLHVDARDRPEDPAGSRQALEPRPGQPNACRHPRESSYSGCSAVPGATGVIVVCGQQVALGRVHAWQTWHATAGHATRLRVPAELLNGARS